MTVGLLKEPAHETRVSLLAEAVATLTKKNITVLVEKAAGDKAFCLDSDYEKAGASIKSRSEVLAAADIILSIHAPAPADIDAIGSKVLLGLFQALYNKELI